MFYYYNRIFKLKSQGKSFYILYEFFNFSVVKEEIKKKKTNFFLIFINKAVVLI